MASVWAGAAGGLSVVDTSDSDSLAPVSPVSAVSTLPERELPEMLLVASASDAVCARVLLSGALSASGCAASEAASALLEACNTGVDEPALLSSPGRVIGTLEEPAIGAGD